MNTFVYVILFALLLDIAAKAIALCRNDLSRTPGAVAFDLVLNVALLAWGFFVLGGSK